MPRYALLGSKAQHLDAQIRALGNQLAACNRVIAAVARLHRLVPSCVSATLEEFSRVRHDFDPLLVPWFAAQWLDAGTGPPMRRRDTLQRLPQYKRRECAQLHRGTTTVRSGFDDAAVPSTSRHRGSYAELVSTKLP